MFGKLILLCFFLLHKHGETGSDVPIKNTYVDMNKLATNIERQILLRSLLDTKLSAITKIALIEFYMGDDSRITGSNLTKGNIYKDWDWDF
jgi:hypothetical protein